MTNMKANNLRKGAVLPPAIRITEEELHRVSALASSCMELFPQVAQFLAREMERATTVANVRDLHGAIRMGSKVTDRARGQALLAMSSWFILTKRTSSSIVSRFSLPLGRPLSVCRQDKGSNLKLLAARHGTSPCLPCPTSGRRSTVSKNAAFEPQPRPSGCASHCSSVHPEARHYEWQVDFCACGEA